MRQLASSMQRAWPARVSTTYWKPQTRAKVGYHCFGSKDALVRELIGHYLKGMPTVDEGMLSALDFIAGIEASVSNQQRLRSWPDNWRLSDRQPRWRTCQPARAAAARTPGCVCDVGGRADEGPEGSALQRQPAHRQRPDHHRAVYRGGGRRRPAARQTKSSQPLLACISQLKVYLKGMSFGASRGVIKPRKLAPLSFCP